MMKTTRFLTMAAAAMMVAMLPMNPVNAEEAMVDSVTVGSTMTVNGHPATPAQKAVAKDMAKQGAEMGKKAAKMAATAVTNPRKAGKMAKELEAMGDEMERLGDSLATLAEDTTFLYEGEDTDEVVVTGGGIRDFVRGVKDGWHSDDDDSWFSSTGQPWWEVALIYAAIFLVLLLIFLFVTAPIWILLLIIWLVYRSNKRHEETIQKAVENGQPVPPSIFDAPTGTDAYLWRKGMNQVAWGVGLLIAALVLASRLIAAIGLILGCLGASKLYLSKNTKKPE